MRRPDVLRAGDVHAIEPDTGSKVPAFKLVRICKSSDHLKTAMGYERSEAPSRARLRVKELAPGPR